MALLFNIMFDVSDSSRIEYDGTTHNLHTNRCLSARKNVCELLSPYNLFKLFVDSKDGLVIGLETNYIDWDKLTKTTFDLPSFFEGKVRVITDFGKLRPSSKYLLDFDGLPEYDNDNGLIVFGKMRNEGMTVKFFSNALITIDFMGNISNIVIKL